MPPRNRPLRRQVRFSGRRRPSWGEVDQSLSVAAGGFSNLDMLADWEVAGTDKVGSTLTRTLLRVQWSPAAVADTMWFGILLGRAADVGTAAPAYALAATLDLPWAWHLHDVPTASGATVDATRVLNFDLRSMRRFRSLQDRLMFCVVNPNGTARTVSVWARMVLALP